jgi:hypothetical protein
MSDPKGGAAPPEPQGRLMLLVVSAHTTEAQTNDVVDGFADRTCVVVIGNDDTDSWFDGIPLTMLQTGEQEAAD